MKREAEVAGQRPPLRKRRGGREAAAAKAAAEEAEEAAAKAAAETSAREQEAMEAIELQMIEVEAKSASLVENLDTTSATLDAAERAAAELPPPLPSVGSRWTSTWSCVAGRWRAR